MSVGLGRVNGRRFCFSAGIGIDAEVVRSVDARGRKADGRRPGDVVFAATAVGVLARKRLHARAAARGRRPRPRGVRARGLRTAVHLRRAGAAAAVERRRAASTSSRPCASRRRTLPRLGLRLLRGTLARDGAVLAGSGLDAFEVRCDLPLPLQADGEDLGDVTEVRFEAEPDALAGAPLRHRPGRSVHWPRWATGTRSALAAGLGVAIGILAAGFFRAAGWPPSLAALVGLGLGLLVENWQEAVAGFVGGFLGGLGATPIVAGALAGVEATRGGLAVFVTIAAVNWLGAAGGYPIRRRSSGTDRHGSSRCVIRKAVSARPRPSTWAPHWVSTVAESCWSTSIRRAPCPSAWGYSRNGSNAPSTTSSWSVA